MSGGPAPVEQLVLALRRLNRTFVTTNRAVGATLGIKEGDLAVLDLLHQEGPLGPTEVARRTRTHAATMTGILTRLERHGWIERVADTTDRRSVRIQTTGVTRLSDIYAHTNAQLAALVETWSDEQVSVVTDLLRSVSELGERLTVEFGDLPRTEPAQVGELGTGGDKVAD